ncbi:MAG: hypothetical protein V1738_06085 [Patescibacteria group bacterium]
MLDQLFGSKTRVRLLRLFLANQDESYFVRQLTRKIDAQINAVRNELDNLVSMGVVKEVNESDLKSGTGKSAQQRKYYRINTEAVLYPELRALFSKSGVLLEKEFVLKLSRAGKVHYLALMGHFVGESGAPTDIFIVGNLQKDKLSLAVKSFEQAIGREINYTIFTPTEYRYRKDLTDRFLYGILECRKIAVVDVLNQLETANAVKEK